MRDRPACGRPAYSGRPYGRLAYSRPACGHSLPKRCLGDEQLMHYVARGDDPLAFAALYERHIGSALRLALQICARHALAEEVVQEAFLSLWRNRSRYDRRRGSVRAWLLWTVRNRAIDVLRQSGAHDGLPSAELDEHALHAHESTDDQASRREDTRRVLTALEGLPPDQSAVIALAYYGGYTQSEIASILGAPIGTVKGRMRLGLHKMAQSFSSA